MKLDSAMSTRYLGVNIDSSLDWKEHIKMISSKVSRAIGFLKHARNFIPQDITTTLYTGLYSHIFVTAVPYGAVALKQILTKSYKIEPQEL